jgi:hypothetical protein
MLSTNDASLTALVPPAIQAASAATRAADLTQTKLKECLEALQMLSGHLNRHAEITSAVAVEMRRQPACQELAIERELVAGIQAEAAHRAAHIARLRGHCAALTPFSQVLESLKAEAALKLQRLSGGGGGSSVPITTAIARVAAAVPPSTEVTKDRIDNIERGLHAINVHVNQLVRLQTAAAAAAAPPIQQAVGASNAVKTTTLQQQQQPILETSPEPVVVPPPRIQEISPGGTEQPEIIRSLTYKTCQQQQPQALGEERRERQSPREDKQQQQVKETPTPLDNNNTNITTAIKRKAETSVTQSRALRGDAAPSSSTDKDEENENLSSGRNKSHTNTTTDPGSSLNPGSSKRVGNEQEQEEQPEFCFVAPAGSGGKNQQQEEEEPSPTPQVAPNTKNTARDAVDEFEKENIDLTQSQGDGSGGSKQQEPEKEEEEEDNVPATLPLEDEDLEEPIVVEEEREEEEIREPPAAGRAAAPRAPLIATGPQGIRGFLSQRDSYSPGNPLNPGASGGAHTGSGSGSGVARGPGAAAAGGGGVNEDTPAGPSRVAPTPVSLSCCPPPLPPPSFPSSSSIGAAAAAAAGGTSAGAVNEKRNYHATVAGGNGGNGGGSRVKRTRFASEAAANAAMTGIEQEKSSNSQDADADLPLSGPSSGNFNSDGSGSGGAPAADWKTPGGEVGATPFDHNLYHMHNYHQHKSWVPSTIKPARNRAKGNQPPLFFSGGGGVGGWANQQLFPLSQEDQEDSPRVAGAQKGATQMFLNSFPVSGGGIGATAVTPATCASLNKSGSGGKGGGGGSEMKRTMEGKIEEDGYNASNQLKRKTPGS